MNKRIRLMTEGPVLRAVIIIAVVLGWILSTSGTSAMQSIGGVEGPAVPLACTSGVSKTGDPSTGYSTGQITFCPSVATVKVCDYFTSQDGGCPGSTRLANTTIQFTCVS